MTLTPRKKQPHQRWLRKSIHHTFSRNDPSQPLSIYPIQRVVFYDPVFLSKKQNIFNGHFTQTVELNFIPPARHAYEKAGNHPDPLADPVLYATK